ncbi:MAG: penicillin acylase family protein [Pirellulales bacterium]
MPPIRSFCKTILICAVLLLQVATSVAEQVEVLRDPWGIPHVFATTDEGAFYGLGYATAEDRAFQMTYSLRIVQGRLAEVIGDVKMLTRDDTAVDNDRKMRTFGFHRAAQRIAANLDADTRSLLDAYCSGVNDWFREHQDDLPPLFAETGLTVEKWTPADCLSSWWHIGQFFATDGTRDLIASRNTGRELEIPAGLDPMPPDDSPAVVQRSDLDEQWIARVEQYARQHGMASDGSGAQGPKFSHAWVVGGERTTTGSSVLVSDPQTPVRNPSLFYEFHIQGATFNTRGMGVPGSPILLIGFTDKVAWGMTALGADQADLFLLDTDPARPDEYRLDGEWTPMTVHPEVIKVKGGPSVNFTVCETSFGPVATEFCYARPADGQVALKRIPMCETGHETIQGAIAMIRASDARQFDAALEGWRFPSANVVFGDRDGNIGYRAIGAIPVRSRSDDSHGRRAAAGHRSDQDWQEILPHEVQPGVLNPQAGFLYSGNHRPIEAWYPIHLGAMTGSGGDTVRSWRLRERLTAQEEFAPEDVRAIHYDAVNPARRDIVRLGLHLRDGQQADLSEGAMSALGLLEPWYRGGASMSLAEEGSALALELNTFFRFVTTDLAFQYGGGESGLAYFLKSATRRIEHDPTAELTERERAFIDQSLSSAWQACRNKYGTDPSRWQQQARTAVTERQLGYYESLDNFPALDAAHAVPLPPLDVVDGGTIACQTAQSYTQWVPMHDPDLAQSVLPIGQSERPDSEYRHSTYELWATGKLHPAPLSKHAVEALGVTRVMIEAR